MTMVSINAAALRPSNGQAGPSFMPESDLILPTIPASEIETINAFYRARPALAFPLAGHTVTMTASWPSMLDDVSDRLRLDITVDGTPGALVLPRPLLRTLIGELDPNQALDLLDPRHLALLLELALADALSMLEAVLGSLLAINSVRTAGDMEHDAVSLAFRFSVDGAGSSSGELVLPSRHAIRFAQFLDRCAAGAAPAIELPVPVRVRVAAATCSVGEIATLRPGDVVMADRSCHEAQTAVAVFSERLAAPVQLTAAGARLAAPPVRIQGSVWEWSMENGRDSSQGEALEKTDLDDIPVKLLFELGRIELSLAEVRQLAPGALIPVPRPLEESVDISANGRCIGRGKLVRVGDNLGVRITRLFHHG
jgi:type III secretion protein Q